ncbi:UNVERIFIED_CONTAM: hypothetical protein HDU68_009236 [Siphonaria sp. JEL0065]|nr:hypothetical protein HDU68_009236 [Siphonaria sp. JEL0065]
MLESIPIPPSDGDLTVLPFETPPSFVLTDASNWLEKLSIHARSVFANNPLLIHSSNIPSSSIGIAPTAVLKDFPSGYKLYLKTSQNQDGSERKEKYLYGHASNKPFRSHIEFQPHLEYLILRVLNPELTCSCKVCVSAARKASPTPSPVKRHAATIIAAPPLNFPAKNSPTANFPTAGVNAPAVGTNVADNTSMATTPTPSKSYTPQIVIAGGKSALDLKIARMKQEREKKKAAAAAKAEATSRESSIIQSRESSVVAVAQAAPPSMIPVNTDIHEMAGVGGNASPSPRGTSLETGGLMRLDSTPVHSPLDSTVSIAHPVSAMAAPNHHTFVSSGLSNPQNNKHIEDDDDEDDDKPIFQTRLSAFRRGSRSEGPAVVAPIVNAVTCTPIDNTTLQTPGTQESPSATEIATSAATSAASSNNGKFKVRVTSTNEMREILKLTKIQLIPDTLVAASPPSGPSSTAVDSAPTSAPPESAHVFPATRNPTPIGVPPSPLLQASISLPFPSPPLSRASTNPASINLNNTKPTTATSALVQPSSSLPARSAAPMRSADTTSLATQPSTQAPPTLTNPNVYPPTVVLSHRPSMASCSNSPLSSSSVPSPHMVTTPNTNQPTTVASHTPASQKSIVPQQSVTAVPSQSPLPSTGRIMLQNPLGKPRVATPPMQHLNTSMASSPKSGESTPPEALAVPPTLNYNAEQQSTAKPSALPGNINNNAVLARARTAQAKMVWSSMAHKEATHSEASSGNGDGGDAEMALFAAINNDTVAATVTSEPEGVDHLVLPSAQPTPSSIPPTPLSVHPQQQQQQHQQFPAWPLPLFPLESAKSALFLVRTQKTPQEAARCQQMIETKLAKMQPLLNYSQLEKLVARFVPSTVSLPIVTIPQQQQRPQLVVATSTSGVPPKPPVRPTVQVFQEDLKYIKGKFEAMKPMYTKSQLLIDLFTKVGGHEKEITVINGMRNLFDAQYEATESTVFVNRAQVDTVNEKLAELYRIAQNITKNSASGSAPLLQPPSQQQPSLVNPPSIAIPTLQSSSPADFSPQERSLSNNETICSPLSLVSSPKKPTSREEVAYVMAQFSTPEFKFYNKNLHLLETYPGFDEKVVNTITRIRTVFDLQAKVTATGEQQAVLSRVSIDALKKNLLNCFKIVLGDRFNEVAGGVFAAGGSGTGANAGGKVAPSVPSASGGRIGLESNSGVAQGPVSQPVANGVSSSSTSGAATAVTPIVQQPIETQPIQSIKSTQHFQIGIGKEVGSGSLLNSALSDASIALAGQKLVPTINTTTALPSINTPSGVDPAIQQCIGIQPVQPKHSASIVSGIGGGSGKESSDKLLFKSMSDAMSAVSIPLVSGGQPVLTKAVSSVPSLSVQASTPHAKSATHSAIQSTSESASASSSSSLPDSVAPVVKAAQTAITSDNTLSATVVPTMQLNELTTAAPVVLMREPVSQTVTVPTQKESLCLNTQVIWDEINCDICTEKPLMGTRYKCATCPDFDLCETCYKNLDKAHHSTHKFFKLESKDEIFQTLDCDGCNSRGLVGVRHQCRECPKYHLCAQCVVRGSEIHPQHKFESLLAESKRIIQPEVRFLAQGREFSDGPRIPSSQSPRSSSKEPGFSTSLPVRGTQSAVIWELPSEPPPPPPRPTIATSSSFVDVAHISSVGKRKASFDMSGHDQPNKKLYQPATFSSATPIQAGALVQEPLASMKAIGRIETQQIPPQRNLFAPHNIGQRVPNLNSATSMKEVQSTVKKPEIPPVRLASPAQALPQVVESSSTSSTTPTTLGPPKTFTQEQVNAGLDRLLEHNPDLKPPITLEDVRQLFTKMKNRENLERVVGLLNEEWERRRLENKKRGVSDSVGGDGGNGASDVDDHTRKRVKLSDYATSSEKVVQSVNPLFGPLPVGNLPSSPVGSDGGQSKIQADLILKGLSAINNASSAGVPSAMVETGNTGVATGTGVSFSVPTPSFASTVISAATEAAVDQQTVAVPDNLEQILERINKTAQSKAEMPHFGAFLLTNQVKPGEPFVAGEYVWVPVIICTLQKYKSVSINVKGQSASKIDLEPVCNKSVYWPAVVKAVCRNLETSICDVWKGPILVDELDMESIALSQSAEYLNISSGNNWNLYSGVLQLELEGFVDFPIFMESDNVIKRKGMEVSSEYVLQLRGGAGTWDDVVRIDHVGVVVEKYLKSLCVVAGK